MSWLSNLLGGGPGAEPPPEPGEQEPRERALQLCVGARRAARALPEDRSRDLRREVGEATRALEERIERAIPRHPETEGPEPAEADGLLEGAVDALERLHVGLLRAEVYGEDPGELGLSDALEEIRGVASRLEGISDRPDAAPASGGGGGRESGERGAGEGGGDGEAGGEAREEAG